MISQFFILSNRGDAIIFRDYRGELSKDTTDLFFTTYLELKKHHGFVDPAFFVQGVHFLFIERDTLLLVFATMVDCSPTMAISLLIRLATIIKDYCGVFTEDAIRKNFVLVYELLDETLDNGYPQCTSTDLLLPFVYNEAIPPSSARSAPSWAQGTSTRQSSVAANRPITLAVGQDSVAGGANEVFVDLIESLAVTITSEGQVVRGQIDGQLQMRSYLHGEPQVTIAFNPDLFVRNREMRGPTASMPFDDISFHECVNTGSFDTGRSLWLRPPHGQITLMTYRISRSTFPIPLLVYPALEYLSDERADLILRVRADFPSGYVASNVSVCCPIPKSVSGAAFTQSNIKEGHLAEFHRKDSVILWMMDTLQGKTEEQLRIKLTLPEYDPHLRMKLGPINLEFEVAMYLPSNTQIKQLTIAERSEDYAPHRWVRYITQASSYVCRI